MKSRLFWYAVVFSPLCVIAFIGYLAVAITRPSVEIWVLFPLIFFLSAVGVVLTLGTYLHQKHVEEKRGKHAPGAARV